MYHGATFEQTNKIELVVRILLRIGSRYGNELQLKIGRKVGQSQKKVPSSSCLFTDKVSEGGADGDKATCLSHAPE